MKETQRRDVMVVYPPASSRPATAYCWDESRLPPPEQKNVLDFARASGALSEKELSITEMSASVLVAEMGAGKLSAEEVVVAFLKRSVIGQQLVYASIFSIDDLVSVYGYAD